MKTFWLVKPPVYLLGFPKAPFSEIGRFIIRFPLAYPLRMQHEVTDQRSARIEA